MPYAIVVVELEEGPRLVGNLRDLEPADLALDLAVEAVLEPISDTVALVHFRPALVTCARMELWELVAREAIRETVASYAHLVDSGRFDDVVDLFTADGVLEVKGREPAVGHDGLRAFFRGVGDDLAETTTVPLIRHYTSNLSIDVVGRVRSQRPLLFPRADRNGRRPLGPLPRPPRAE